MKILTVVESEDRNSQRLLNTFLDKNIAVRKAIRKDGKITFSIEDCYLEQVEKTLKACRVQYTVKRRGGSYLTKKLVLRYSSLVIAAILTIMAICLGSGLCLGVEIECLNGTQKAQIETILEEFQYKKFMQKSSLDTKALSMEITSRIDGAGFANCYFDGGILKIDVKQVHTDKEESEYSQIVAARDGIITRVLVYSGTAMVQAGDVVKAGDVLIAGYVDTYPDTDDNERIAVEAAGEVYAECAYTQRVTLSSKSVEKVRTGKSYENTAIYLFGKPIGKTHTPKYEFFESVTETKTFGSVIPVKAVTTTYYEVENREITLSDEQIDAQISVYEMQLWQELPPQAKLLKNYTLRKRVDNLHIIDIYYIVEQAICQGV